MLTSSVKHLRLTELADTILQPVDVFLCSASYEDRSISVSSAIAGNIRLAMICHHRKLSSPAAKNLRRLQDIFGGRAVMVPVERFAPIRTADSIQTALSRLGVNDNPHRYLIDITTFTHENLLILLSILRMQLSRKDSVEFVYTAAAEYGVALTPEDKWLSKGVQDVRSVLGYPGTIRPARNSHLIVLVGFEADRAVELIESYEPSFLSLGFGDETSATGPGHFLINKSALRSIANKTRSYGEFSFSTTDPYQTEMSIKAQIESVPGCNILIAPMNTKISTLGAAIVAFGNSDIRLCYASALIYNVQGYSKPGNDCYVIPTTSDFWHRPKKIQPHASTLWTKGAREHAAV